MHICTLTKLLRLCTPLPPPLPRYPTARAFQRALAPRAPGLDHLAAAAADTGECSKIWDEAETETDEGPVPEEEEEADEEEEEADEEEEGIPGPPLVTSIPGEPTGGKMYWGAYCIQNATVLQGGSCSVQMRKTRLQVVQRR